MTISWLWYSYHKCIFCHLNALNLTENKLSSGRRLRAKLGGGAGILQNVANGSNITFLSCYESTGRLFKARAAWMQSSCVTTANRDYLEIFPTGSWWVINHANFVLYLCSVPHMYTCPQENHLAHRYRLSITNCTMEDHGGPACQVDTWTRKEH